MLPTGYVPSKYAAPRKTKYKPIPRQKTPPPPPRSRANNQPLPPVRRNVRPPSPPRRVNNPFAAPMSLPPVVLEGEYIEDDIQTFLGGARYFGPTRTDFGDRYLVYPRQVEPIGTRASIRITDKSFRSSVDVITSTWGFLPHRLEIPSSSTFEYKGTVNKSSFEAWFLRETEALIADDSTINITGEILLCKILDLPAYYHRYVKELGDPFQEYMDTWNNRDSKVATYTVAHPVAIATWYRTGIQFGTPDIEKYNLFISYNTVSNGDDADAPVINLTDTRKYLVLTPESVKRARSTDEADQQIGSLIEASSQGSSAGSDLASLKFNFIHNVVYFFKKRSETVRKTRRGAFLPYILDMEKPDASMYVDICKVLQIFNTAEDLYISTSCCLEHAINIALGNMGAPLITIDRRFIEQGAIRTRYLGEICRDLDICIKLRRCRAVEDVNTPCNSIETFNRDSSRVVDILLVLDHYMHYVPSRLYVNGDPKSYTTRTLLVSLLTRGLIRPMTREELDKCSPKAVSTEDVFQLSRKQEEVVADCVVQDLDNYRCMPTNELFNTITTLKSEKDRSKVLKLYNSRFPFDGEDYYTVYFDTETANFENKVIPYLLYYIVYTTKRIPNTLSYKYTTHSSRCFISTTPGIYLQRELKALLPMEGCEQVNVRLIAHNLGFDMASLWTVFGRYDSCLGTRSRPKQVKYVVHNKEGYTRNYVFTDSYNLMKMRIADMPKRFNLKGAHVDSKLEFPYDFVTSDVAMRIVNDDAYVELSELEEFYKSITPEDKLESTLKDLYSAIEVTKARVFGVKLPSKYMARAIKGAKFIDMSKFAAQYCLSDVLILANAHQAFMRELNGTMDIVAERYVTTASWAYAYLIQNGGMQGSVSIRGELRLYLTNSIYGGRCMTRDNKAWHLVSQEKPKEGWSYISVNGFTGWIYYDGVSLYPSAMIRMGGVPKGPPDVMTSDLEQILSLVDSPFYICTVVIIDVPYNVPFSNLVRRTKKGLVYDNDFRGEIVLCKYDVDILNLFDFVIGVHYKIVYGVFWFKMSGKLGEVINNVFQRRVYIKSKGAVKPDGTPYTKEEKVVEALLKEQMNSSYGKPIQKFFSTISKYIVDYNDFDTEYAEDNMVSEENKGILRELKSMESIEYAASTCGDDVKSIYTVLDGPVTRLDSEGKEYESNETHMEIVTAARAYDTKNRVQVGTAILGMARLIMAEVYWCIYKIERLDTEESGEVKRYVYYGDTDSMLIDQTIIPRLKVIYKEKFGRDLEGTGVGQFHSDFTPPKTDPVTKLENVVCEEELPRAIESYIIGKKFYSHLVQYKRRPYVDGKLDEENWEWATYYHNKMKGVPKSLVGGLTLKDYKRFYDGKVHEFDLLEGGKKFRPVFHAKTNQMYKMTEFTREVRRLIPRHGHEAEDEILLENLEYEKNKRDKLKSKIMRLERKMV